jgi:hypothetical protein
MLQDIIILERVKDALSASTLSYIHPISQEELSPYTLKVEILGPVRSSKESAENSTMLKISGSFRDITPRNL